MWCDSRPYLITCRISENQFLFLKSRSKKGISVVDSSKAGMRFRNKDLESMNKEYRMLSDDYDKQQQYVVNEILEIA